MSLYGLRTTYHIEVEQLRSILKCNNYPVYIIDQCIKTFLDKLYADKQLVSTVSKRIINCSSIFRKIFDKFENTFVKLVSKTLPQCNIKVSFESVNQLSNLFKSKNHVPFYLCVQLIYKL